MEKQYFEGSADATRTKPRRSRMLVILILTLHLAGSTPPGEPSCIRAIEELELATAEYEKLHDPGGPLERMVSASQRVRDCEPVGSSAWIGGLVAEGTALVRQGKSGEAIELYSTFIDEHFDRAGPNDQARVLLNRGTTYMNSDRLLDAVRDFIAARPLADHESYRMRYTIHGDLGSTYRLIGAHENSIASFRAMIGVAAEMQDIESLAFAHARHADAVANYWSRGSRRNLDVILAAVAEAESAAGMINDYVIALGDAANHHVRFRRTEANMTWYRTLSFAGMHEEALEVARTIPHLLAEEFIPHETIGLLALGAALERAGRNQEAYEVLKRAAGQERIRAQFVPQVNRLLGRALINLNRLDEAEDALLSAIEAYAEYQRGLGASEWASLTFNFAQPAHRLLIALYLMQGRAPEAFSILDGSRARSVRNARLVAGARTDDLTEARQTDFLREQLRNARRASQLAPESDSLRETVAALEIEIAARDARIQADGSVDLEVIQAGLAEDGRTIVTYFLDDEWPSFAFVLRSDTLAAIELPLRARQLWDAVERSRLSGHAGERSFEPDPAALYELYQAVFAPIEHLLPEGTSVTIVPEGPLLEVPFAMLIDRPGDRFQYHEWSFLLRRHAFSYDLAASLRNVAHLGASSVPLVAYGRSDFGVGDVIPGLTAEVPPPLPSVRRELASLQRLVPGGRFAYDERATRMSFLDAMSDARIVHIASHVYLSPARPLFSAILLSPEAGDLDGALYLHEIVGRSLPSDLVVVSACESGAGELRQGEGIVGLHYAFRSAGAAATVATLWPVDDEAMTELMERFYRELVRGVPKDVALQRAQIGFLQGRTRLAASPFLWAGVLLSGDPGPVLFDGDNSRSTLWLFAALLFLAAATAVGRRWSARKHPA